MTVRFSQRKNYISFGPGKLLTLADPKWGGDGDFSFFLQFSAKNLPSKYAFQ